MPDCSQLLPRWVSYSQALAVPLLALVVAASGVLISARQMLIADNKLKLDAFDRQYNRRVAVYEATRNFLASVFSKQISDDEMRVYGLYTLDAQFLFDETTYKYLREVYIRVAMWRDTIEAIDKAPVFAEKEQLTRMRTEQMKWIIQQGDETTGFATRFAPFLVYKKTKRPWLLRWLDA